MKLGTIVFMLCSVVLPALAAAQGYPAVNEQSVIRPAGYGWRNYVAVPDGPCGCAMPVRADCYNPCPHCCCLQPLCLLHKVGRMLDCLLPCNRCCHNCCTSSCCHVGDCLLGGRCGGCGPSCAGGCPSCGSTLPGLGDPFQDDAMPPRPTAQPTTETRMSPPRRIPAAMSQARAMPSSPPRTSPWKVTGAPAAVVAPPYDNQTSGRRYSPRAVVPGYNRSLGEQSILRRASLAEEVFEPARLPMSPTNVRPIIRSQSPGDDVTDYDIPVNPLRR